MFMMKMQAVRAMHEAFKIPNTRTDLKRERATATNSLWKIFRQILKFINDQASLHNQHVGHYDDRYFSNYFCIR